MIPFFSKKRSLQFLRKEGNFDFLKKEETLYSYIELILTLYSGMHFLFLQNIGGSEHSYGHMGL